MAPEDNLSPGFIKVKKAVELIESDTRDNPVVDMDYLVSRLKWVETGWNFRIPLIKRLAEKDIYKTKRGKIVEYEHIGDVYIYIATNYDKELVKKTILDKFRELVGHEYREDILRATSTVADDGQGRDAVRPRANKPIAKEGASIGSGETVNSNGENLTV